MLPIKPSNGLISLSALILTFISLNSALATVAPAPESTSLTPQSTTAAAASAPSSVPSTTPNITSDDCQDLLDTGFNAACWDLLNMTSWMNDWNTSTQASGKCHHNELWSNCFQRLTGVQGITGLGCAVVGNDTCPEPDADVILTVSVETAYGSYAIYALQQLITYLSLDLGAPSGIALIQQGFSNFSDSNATHTNTPIGGNQLLCDILYTNHDNRTDLLGEIIETDWPIPGTTIDITEMAQAPAQLQGLLGAYLLSFMSNYTLNGKNWGFTFLTVGGLMI